MGSAALLDSTASDSLGSVDSSERKSKKRKEKSAVPKSKKDSTTCQKENKQKLSHGCDEPDGSRKRPKRAAACTDFKEKSIHISEKSFLVKSKEDQFADEELAAVGLTAGQEDGRPNRRLSDFILHNEDGVPQPLEMLEIDDLFISGLILPLEESSDQEKEKAIRCEGFGRIESWNISGYEDGSPVIWLSTDIADYDCRKPASSYKKYYEFFFEKARVCVEVYKKLSKASGGNSDCSLNELLARVVRSMSGSKCFCSGASIKDFIISQGEFIYNQLLGLDETSKNSDQKFTGLPVLIALRDECSKHENFMQAKATSLGGTLTIGPKFGDEESKMDQSGSLTEEDEDAKLARLLQEEEFWLSKKQKKTRGSASSSNKFYIKINEDEIANDYPFPAYYKSFDEETDELVVCDEYFGVCDIDELPRSMLHNWSLYNSDSRLISLELLPMKPCADIDVTIYGSGHMTDDDGSGFCLDTDPNQSSAEGAVSGFPIFLSAIKEWMIEFGSSMVFISIRTDAAW